MTSSPSLAGRLTIVTGAASGIGEATVGLLAGEGARVIAVDRDEDGLARLAAGRESIVPLVADVTDPALPERLSRTLESIGDPLAGLVNNAGIGRGGMAEETSDAELEQFLAVNLVSAFRLSRFAVGAMRAAGGGAIVNVASIYSIVGATASAGYSASKAALAGLTRQMATDYGPENIRVNAVAPGLIETPLTRERIASETWRRHIFIEQAPLRRVGQPIDVARVIAFLLGDAAGFVTGETVRVDGGWAMGRYPRPEAAR